MTDPTTEPGVEPRDRRRRRWTIVLVLLGLVVVAGVALRIVDSTRSNDARSSDAAVEATSDGDREREQGDDEPADEPAAAPEPPPVPSGPYEIQLEQYVDPTGATATNVFALGPVTLGSDASLPNVTAQVGEPDSSGPTTEDPDVCGAEWVELGLYARFYYGHPPSPERSCSDGPLAAARMTGREWVIASNGLAVGDPASQIDVAYPDAEVAPLGGLLATMAGATSARLLEQGSYGGTPYPTLYAVVADERIDAFVYVSGAD
jgi:hypothetical protein